MAKDPYRYFRIEARELHQKLSRGAIALGQEGAHSEELSRILRHAHTLKGAARVVKAMPIADAAHAIEDLFAPFREKTEELPPEAVEQALELLDRIGAHILSLDGPSPPPQQPSLPQGEQHAPLDSVRIEVRRLDDLLEQIAAASVALHGLERQEHDLSRALGVARRIATLSADAGRGGQVRQLAEELVVGLKGPLLELNQRVESAGRSIDAATHHASGLRLMAVSEIFPSLERAVHDAAQAAKRSARLDTEGGACRLDAHILVALREALLHVVRNAVAHGIEPEADRLACDKAARGTVAIRVERGPHRVRITCKDDGRGIDTEAIRALVRTKRIVSEHEAAGLVDEDLFELVFRGGVTTRVRADAVSGRGVGLEVVREVVGSCNGSVRLRSTAGRGTSVEIVVPISLATVRVLLVDDQGRRFAIPVDAVLGAHRSSAGDFVVAEDVRLNWGEGAVPYAELSRALGWRSNAASGEGRGTAVVLEAGPHRASLGITRIVGTVDVTVQPVPRMAGNTPGVDGIFLGPDGRPVPVIDPSWLVSSIRTVKAPIEVVRREPRVVLVIDDSLTSRMLQQSILEMAGFDVDVAASAEEGMALALQRRYAAYLVDVELPGMNGFDFVASTRSQPLLAETPAILITSRAADEDRRRGMNAGAHAYIVKSEFDEKELIRTLRSLIG